MAENIKAGTDLYLSNAWDKHGEYQSLFSTRQLALDDAVDEAASMLEEHGFDDAVPVVQGYADLDERIAVANEILAEIGAGVSVVAIRLEK